MEKEVFVTRRERFNAAHKLHREEWSEAKNFEVFGVSAFSGALSCLDLPQIGEFNVDKKNLIMF